MTSSGGQLFSKHSIQKLMLPQYRPHPDFPGVAFGFNDMGGFSHRNGTTPRSISHGGTMFGFQSSLDLFPEVRTGIFVTTNRNFETGGGPVSLHGALKARLEQELFGPRPEVLHTVPELKPQADVSDYAGTYYFDLFCHTCSAEELEAGAWQRPEATVVSAESGTIRLREKTYRPTDDDGVFVSDDGKRKVFFRRGSDGQVSSFSWISSQEAFVKANPSLTNQ
ncbi:MAG: hypothetical protein HRU11_14105 [Parvularculaceae bacterium]|nr:hypothetical protein [Parvularculaceae bacterium]